MAQVINDTDWFREANVLPAGAIRKDDIYYREYTPAAYKFTDTTLGGNFALNAPPQYCTNGDPVTKRYIDILNGTDDNMPYDRGMGRWYSEVIDDNAVLLHMRFGLPVYNSLFQFFGNFYNSDASSIARTGKSSGFFNLIGKAIGWAFSVRMLPLIMTGAAWKFFAGTTQTRFMYLKPMMGTYWKYVSDIANTVASNKEMTAQMSNGWMEFADKMSKSNGGNQNFEQVAKAAAASTMRNFSDETNSYAAMLPDIYKSKDDANLLSGIDIYSVATRAQRLANAFHRGIRDNASVGGTSTGPARAIHNWMESGQATKDLTKALNSPNYKLAEDYLSDYFQRQGRVGGAANAGTDNSAPASNPDAPKQQQNATQNKASATPAYGQTQAQADAAAAARATLSNTPASTASYADRYASGMGAQVQPPAQPAPAAASATAPASATPGADAGANYDESANTAGAATSEGVGSAVQQSLVSSAWESVKDFFTVKSGTDTDSFGALLQGYEADGSGWVTFRINGRNSVSESFGNSSRESGIGQTINSVSTSAREMRNNIAGGKVFDIPVVGSVVGGVADIVTGVLNGVGASFMVNGVAALSGNAFVDIPKHWDSSSMSFQQMSFEMELRAPYGNNLSQFQCETVPYIAALAGCLPQATGAESHTQPFYCEWYCRGRGSSRLSLIKGVNVERGVSNAPWAPDGRYRGMNVRIDVEELSTVIAMPMSSVYGTTTLLDPTNWPRLLFPQDSTFSDYLSVLASCGLTEMVYKTDKFKRNFRHQVSAFSKVYSASSITNSIFDGWRGQLLTALGRSDRS